MCCFSIGDVMQAREQAREQARGKGSLEEGNVLCIVKKMSIFGNANYLLQISTYVFI